VTETGVGVVQTSPTKPQYIAVQLFARPEATKYSFKVRNEATATVSYTFNDETTKIAPREIVTHTLCLPGTIAFDAGGAAAKYETRGGQVYTLKASGSGVKVDVSGK
jgi:lipoprotein-anchoring transpeptidase ErfK/SrfK